MNILSLSGGKDSVASYFLCRHEIDCIIYVGSGVDFPSIKKTALMIGSDFVSRGVVLRFCRLISLGGCVGGVGRRTFVVGVRLERFRLLRLLKGLWGVMLFHMWVLPLISSIVVSLALSTRLLKLV